MRWKGYLAVDGYEGGVRDIRRGINRMGCVRREVFNTRVGVC